MAQVVQFSNINDAVQAFVNRDCKAWSVWSGKQFLFSYVGAANDDAALQLQQLLESLDKTGAGIYTLKVYEEVKVKEKINEKTLCHGSFNFRLTEYKQEQTNWYNHFKDENQQLRAELETIKAEMEEEEEEEESPLNKIGAMIIDDPAKLPLIISSVKNIMEMFTTQTKSPGTWPAQPPAMMPATIGAIGGGIIAGDLQSVIEKLKQHDPRLTEHLNKLATMAEKDKDGFRYLLNILDSIK